MGLNPPNIYVTSILVRSVQVLCTIGVKPAEKVAKEAKNEENGHTMAILRLYFEP